MTVNLFNVLFKLGNLTDCNNVVWKYQHWHVDTSHNHYANVCYIIETSEAVKKSKALIQKTWENWQGWHNHTHWLFLKTSLLYCWTCEAYCWRQMAKLNKAIYHERVWWSKASCLRPHHSCADISSTNSSVICPYTNSIY